LLEEGDVDAEAFVGGFGSGDRLKDQIERRAALDGLERGCYVRQDAGLGGNFIALD
jgi:hypothetical protein